MKDRRPRSTGSTPDRPTPDRVGRVRRRYLSAAALVVVLGLASRRTDAIPDWIGDLLWATMVFFLLSARRPAPTVAIRAATTLAASCLVEFSQLYQADWIDHLRQHPLVHLVLGSTFSWTDLAAYTAGTALAAAADLPLRRRDRLEAN